MQLKKLSAVVMAAGLLSLAGVTNAQTITLAPSALNTGGPGGQICTSCTGDGLSATVVSSIQTTLSSQLDINAPTGTTNWQESGALVFTTYNSASFLEGNRFYSGGSGKYDVYGIFLGSGAGIWTANQFNVNSISSFTIQIYASPTPGTTISVATPTSGTQVNGGVTAGGMDFLLGTATFAGSFGGTNAQLGLSGFATEQLTATFNFAAASVNYTGPTGYFQAPYPFVVSFNGSGSSNQGQSTYTTDGSGVHIYTGAHSGATGNLTPITRAVPEPGALSLVGIALFGLAAVSRRKAGKQS